MSMTSVETLTAILGRYPFAEGLQPQPIENLCGMAYDVPFRKNEIIFREGDECNAFYLIISGTVMLEMLVRGCVLGVETLGPGERGGGGGLRAGGGGGGAGRGGGGVGGADARRGALRGAGGGAGESPGVRRPPQLVS